MKIEQLYDDEIWKNIPNYPNYMISNYGRIFSNNYNKILKQYINKEGYYYVTLYCDSKPKTLTVHRLVALCFIDNPNNYQYVNHLDENKKKQ